MGYVGGLQGMAGGHLLTPHHKKNVSQSVACLWMLHHFNRCEYIDNEEHLTFRFGTVRMKHEIMMKWKCRMPSSERFYCLIEQAPTVIMSIVHIYDYNYDVVRTHYRACLRPTEAVVNRIRYGVWPKKRNVFQTLTVSSLCEIDSSLAECGSSPHFLGWIDWNHSNFLIGSWISPSYSHYHFTMISRSPVDRHMVAGHIFLCLRHITVLYYYYFFVNSSSFYLGPLSVVRSV